MLLLFFFQPIFYQGMQSQFMTVLLQVLVHKSHDLLQEEIVVTIYNMASVEFDRFYAEYLPQFLSGCEGLDDGQKAVLAANFKMEKVRVLYDVLWKHLYACATNFHGYCGILEQG